MSASCSMRGASVSEWAGWLGSTPAAPATASCAGDLRSSHCESRVRAEGGQALNDPPARALRDCHHSLRRGCGARRGRRVDHSRCAATRQRMSTCTRVSKPQSALAALLRGWHCKFGALCLWPEAHALSLLLAHLTIAPAAADSTEGAPAARRAGAARTSRSGSVRCHLARHAALTM